MCELFEIYTEKRRKTAVSCHIIFVFLCRKNFLSEKKSTLFLNSPRICVSLDVNFNELLTNDIVSFEQLGPGDLKHLGSRWYSNTETHKHSGRIKAQTQSVHQSENLKINCITMKNKDEYTWQYDSYSAPE